MKIAIIGTGIAGNVAAYHLSREHDITVFEAGDHVGGHTHTHAIEQDGQRYNVDTGFIVFNDRTYPNFIALLDELGVPSQESAMSFSVRAEQRHRVQRHFAQHPVRAAPQPAEAVVPAHDPRHPALQPRGPGTAGLQGDDITPR
jgi:predicted NAD/FAD-binding protein